VIPTDCPDCNRLAGVVCPAHCLGVHCRDGENVDLRAGPDRSRPLEQLHRHGVPITPQVVAAVLGAEQAARELLDYAGIPAN